MKKPNNPFPINGYWGSTYFCDRKQELAALDEYMQHDYNVVLYSWRRLGKTILIKHFLAEQEKKHDTVTLYVDLLGSLTMRQAVETISQATFAKFGQLRKGISGAIRELLGKIGAEISFDALTGAPKVSLGLRDEQHAQQTLHAIGAYLQANKRRIIMAIDEFQQVQHFSDVQGEAIFRGWTQEFPDIRFVFSGSHRETMRSMFAEKNRPFYRSAQLMPLAPIPKEEYKSFIIRHFKRSNKQISPEVIDAIYDWSQGQTYCIQLICNKLYGRYPMVEISHTQEVYREIIENESAFFITYLNLLSTMQWKMLKAIAKNQPVAKPTATAFLQTNELGAASSANTALKMLEKAELVIREEKGLLLHDILLARWIQSLP